MGLFEFAKYFAAKDELGGLREKEIYDTIRFWTMSVKDYLDEYFESDIVNIGIGQEAASESTEQTFLLELNHPLES